MNNRIKLNNIFLFKHGRIIRTKRVVKGDLDAALVITAIQRCSICECFSLDPPEIRYVKAAKALKDDGSLILLWNLTPEPKYEIYQAIKEVFQAYAPSLVRYEGEKTQANILKGFEQDILSSGCFKQLLTKQISCKVIYSIDEYLNLLSTLRKLKPQTKKLLFKELRSHLERFGDDIQLTFLSAVHIAKKV